MTTFEWAETFISLEGEGPLYQGYPTVYARLTKCNFKCQGFNNPDNVTITNAILGFNPADFNSIKDLPLIKIGCDSLYSHDNRFKHMWKSGDAHELARELVSLLPHNQWTHPVTGQPYLLSITGGEPTSRQKSIPTLLNHPLLSDLKILLIETNCAVPLSDAFITELYKWKDLLPDRKVVWSNSPKLSASGEDWSKAIKPVVALSQLPTTLNVMQYFKFVCSPTQSAFDEVEKAMNEYYDAGIPRTALVGIMPESCTTAQQEQIFKQLAEMCIQRGYIFVLRLQNVLWENQVGT